MKILRLLSALCVMILFAVNPAFAQPERATQFQEHKVKEGETPASIADHFHIKKKDFLMLNNFPPDIKLKDGQIVLVKQLKEGEKPIEENWNTGENSTVYNGPAITPSYSETRTHAPKTTAQPAKTDEQPATTKKTEKTVATTTTSSTTTAPAAPASGLYTKSTDGYHVVEKGQTFYRIALTYGITVDQLKALNNMSNTNISVGQKLKVK